MEPYNAGAEQSNEQGPIILSEMGSWESRRVRDGVNVSDSHHRSDGSKFHSIVVRQLTNVKVSPSTPALSGIRGLCKPTLLVKI